MLEVGQWLWPLAGGNGSAVGLVVLTGARNTAEGEGGGQSLRTPRHVSDGEVAIGSGASGVSPTDPPLSRNYFDIEVLE
jgi:hypothetical protein